MESLISEGQTDEGSNPYSRPNQTPPPLHLPSVEMWKKVWKTFDPVFKGTFEYRIDAKGRLPVPAPFRRVLEDAAETGLVVTMHDQCLAVYPTSQWERVEQ